MDHDNDLDRTLREQLGGPPPPAWRERAARQFADLAASTSAAHPRLRRGAPWLWWTGLGLAGTAAVAALAFLALATPTPTWAQVTERFRQLRFFNATVFVTDAAGAQPERIDLWVAPDRRLRAHYRDLIFFGTDGRIERVLSSATGAPVALADLPAAMRERAGPGRDAAATMTTLENIARLSEPAEPNLDSLLTLLRGRRDQLAPSSSNPADLAGDLEVFDLAAPHASEWARLWVLRRQELPLRLRLWNAANAGQIEVWFDYPATLRDDAFSADDVATKLTSTNGSANRLFAALSDAGGRPLTPAELLAARDRLPMPAIDTVGRTPEGVVWVLSRQAENLRPDGENVPGWDALTDSLGQTYRHHLVGWLPADRMTLEFFVPENLDAGYRRPAAFALQCRARGADGERTGAALGETAVTQWRDGAAVPDLEAAQRHEIGGRTRWELLALDDAADRGEAEDFAELAAAIPGEPERDPVALARELVRLRFLTASRETETAAALASRLYPLVGAQFAAGDPRAEAAVRLHVARLFRNGQHDVARRLANRHVEEALRRSRVAGPAFLVSLLVELRAAGLTEDAARRFFDRDLIELPAVRARTEELRLFGGADAPAKPGTRS